jgi:hypothetical protein
MTEAEASPYYRIILTNEGDSTILPLKKTKKSNNFVCIVVAGFTSEGEGKDFRPLQVDCGLQ